MAETLTRPLSAEERVQKARALIEQGTKEFDAAEKAEAELAIRRRGAIACETAFHALVELADVLIEQAGHAPADTHDSRIEALEDIGRSDLANTYHRVKDALHIGGYSAQRVGRLQADRLRELSEILEREFRKLS
jgi:hypothetical protein